MFKLKQQTRSRVLVSALACTAVVTVSPATAGAYATVGASSTSASVGGLPDGRVYEQASPANKHGNGTLLGAFGNHKVFGNATADGDAVLYWGEGPLAEHSSSGNALALFVSRRTNSGWITRSAMPRGAPGVSSPEENNSFFAQIPLWFFPSADLSQLVFSVDGADVGAPDFLGFKANVYLSGSDPFVEPAWISRPQLVPFGNTANEDRATVVGGSRENLDPVFFAWDGKLLPQDASRESGSSLYEYRDGVLSEAGVLPDGTLSPSGAAPAGAPTNKPDQMGNEVSVDGSRAFFISRDPATDAVPQLYVRETAADGSQSTALVSRDELLPKVGGLPASAPDGPALVATTELLDDAESGPTPQRLGGSPLWVFASPDGSHAFFQSEDQLTSDAPEGPPGNTTLKAYDFNTVTGTLEYVPGLVGSIVTVSTDGSSLLFENTSTSPFELDRWVRGPGGGSVTPVAQLPAGPVGCEPVHGGAATVACVGPARMSADGSVVVFATESPIPGFNDGGKFRQIFRYDAMLNEITCVSCPPAGVSPSGNAVLSSVDYNLNESKTIDATNDVVDARGISGDATHVFFDTPDPLVAQDVNGKRDVYEWENGTVFLLSTGTSKQDSLAMDNSESGNDAFFATTSGLVVGDTDGAYDVYDARVPRPGDNPPPSAVPCQGDVCQGSPSVPSLLGLPSSATFSGVGNVSFQPAGPVVRPKPKKRSSAKVHRKKRRKARGSQRTRRSTRLGKRGVRGGR
jgi:hypothetical protein